MGYSNGVISKPVRMQDISDAFSLPTGELGTLFTTGDINMWSKYKPFVYPAWKFDSDSDRLTARRSRNCGLVMKLYTSNASLYSSMFNSGANSVEWKYDKPKGGATSPFRMLDCDGYDVNKDVPFQLGIYPNPCYKTSTPVVSNMGSLINADITGADLCGDNTAAVATSAYATDYKYYNLSSKYVGVMIGSGRSSILAAKTLGTLDNITPWTLPSTLRPNASTTYYVVPFISDSQFDGTYVSTSGDYFSGPISMTEWVYYNYFPLEGSSAQGVTPVYWDTTSDVITLTFTVLDTFSYNSIKVKLLDLGHSNPSSAITLVAYSTAGNLFTGDTLSASFRKPSTYSDPGFIKFVIDDEDDTRDFVIVRSSL